MRILDEMKRKRIGIESNEQTLMLKVKQQLEINLPSNPTTGYMWVEAKIDDLQVIQLDKADLIPDGPVNSYGKGGTQYWLFTAVNTGQDDILLQYQQPWDDDKIDRTFRLTVVVIP